MDIDIDQLRELMRSLAEFDVNELEIENGDERISLRRGPAAPEGMVAIAGGPHAALSHSPPGAAGLAADTEAAEEDDDSLWVTSPFVGTFYRAAGPDSDPFVAVGSKIEVGTVLCIVEAMKLMNEIEAEVRGTITEILIENGKPVEYGDRLFKVTP
ncbi:MAG: acetyl-CoA carboxylase biotin carboxyl carrier protein [Deltaproteobacteria bacterium]|nr:acetyl-CoA carboxylase biotin carboxyl carrier protein [Deltaproteobacteria bacterium]